MLIGTRSLVLCSSGTQSAQDQKSDSSDVVLHVLGTALAGGQDGYSALGMELNLHVGLLGSLGMRESLVLAIRWSVALPLIRQMNSHRTLLDHDASKALS